MRRKKRSTKQGKGLLTEFRAFVLRGNVVDLAVGVAMGAAFAAVISSLVKDVITPLFTVFNAADFSEMSVQLNGANELRYGLFLNAVVAFLLTAAAIFFFIVKPVNKLMERRKTQPDVESTTRDCPHCLSAIPQLASRCAFCTQAV